MGLLVEVCALCARRLAVGLGGGRPCTAGLVLGLLLALAVPRPSKPERVFHRRDHKDQDIINPYASVKVIENPEQARLWLGKYGYLNCTHYKDSMEETTRSSSSVEEGNRVIYPDCNVHEDEYKEALVLFQRKFRLPQTGKLDFETKQVMSLNRCGNKDTEDAPGQDPSLEGSSHASSADSSSSSAATPVSRSSSASESSEGTDNPAMTQPPESSSRRRAKRHVSDVLARRRRHRAEMRLARQRRAFGPAVREHFPQPQSSLLQKILGPNSPVPFKSSRFRREAMLQEYMDAITREDYTHPARDAHVRQKRSIALTRRVTTYVSPNGTMVFNKEADECVSWKLLEESSRIPLINQLATIHLAFRMWSEVIPLCFTERPNADINSINIGIAFGRREHMGCDLVFDGYGGELGHSWKAGDIHLDDDEDFKHDNSHGISLLKVMVHEIGHVLSLQHEERTYSVMYPVYRPLIPGDEFELGWEDRKEVQKVYGVCKGTFDIIFDWVRWHPVQRLIYNTYFFRSEKYWMYENRYNRTRYGDPLRIEVEWGGIPDNVDGYVQKLWEVGTGKTKYWEVETFFFKGEDYYSYNETDDEILPGYPRKIADDFGPKPNTTERVPDNTDAVFFDHRDRNFYFFKGEWVWVFDPFLEGEERGCCERKARFEEIFPPVEGTPEEEILRGYIDTAYYSWEFMKLYFLKGESVYENVGFTKSGRNGLAKVSCWYQKWYDICDTAPAMMMVPGA